MERGDAPGDAPGGDAQGGDARGGLAAARMTGDDPSKPTHSSMEVDSGNTGEEVEIKMMKLVKLVKRWRCNSAQLTKICPARIVKMVKINMMKS